MKRTTLSLVLMAALAAGAAHAAGSDAEAVAVLGAVNAHEIQSAQLARQKGVGGDVAAYAERMHAEHSANQRETEKLAGNGGLQPAQTDAVKALKSKAAGEREKLAALSGAEFEAAYVDAMVKDHAEVLAKLDNELIPGAQDAALKAHLQKTREHVAHHLEQARALDAKATAAADEEAD